MPVVISLTSSVAAHEDAFLPETGGNVKQPVVSDSDSLPDNIMVEFAQEFGRLRIPTAHSFDYQPIVLLDLVAADQIELPAAFLVLGLLWVVGSSHVAALGRVEAMFFSVDHENTGSVVKQIKEQRP